MRTTLQPITIFLFFALLSSAWAESLPAAAPQNLRLLYGTRNQTPVAMDDSYNALQTAPLWVPSPGVLANDHDPDGDSLTAILISGPSNGSLTLNADGSFNYLPNSRFSGEDSFTYQASDKEFRSKLATVVISVAAEEGLVAYWPLDQTRGEVADDATSYGNQLTFNSDGSAPAWGDGYNGEALIFDGRDDRAQATNIAVNQTPSGKNTVAFWMNWGGSQYDMPFSFNGLTSLYIYNQQFGITNHGGYLTMSGFTSAVYAKRWVHVVAVFANADTTLPNWQAVWAAESKLYIDGVKQELNLTGTPTARIADSSVILGNSPNSTAPFKGALDDVRIYARELSYQEVLTLYHLRASEDIYIRDAQQLLKVSAPGVLSNDTTVEGRKLAALLVGLPKYGNVALHTDGSFVYTANKGYYWGDSFRYMVHDGVSYSNLATVIINTNAPVARDDDEYFTHLNRPVTYGPSGGVLFNDSAVDNQRLTAELLSGPRHGFLVLDADGSFTYKPKAEYIGNDHFTYRAYDGQFHSQAATATILISEVPKPIPELTRWESTMLLYGTHWGNYLFTEAGINDQDNTYYDGQRVYQNIADYTNDSSWLRYADQAEYLFRDVWVLPNGTMQGWWNFTHGLAEDYLRTGDGDSQTAVILMSQKISAGDDSNPLSWYTNYSASREVAYGITAHINAERVGAARRSRLADIFEIALGHIDQWLAKDNPYDDIYWCPFMIGLTSEALIFYWDHIDQDPRILEKLQLIANAIWAVAWQEQHQAFTYRMGESPRGSGAPVLNQLISPLFSWLYLQTGDATYRDRGDKIFAGGALVELNWDTKQFNQNYRWSFDYVKWRRQAEDKLAAAKTQMREW